MSTRTYYPLVVFVCVLGLAWRVSLLDTGFVVDDYAQLSMMEGTYPVERAPLALFSFSNGEATEVQRLRNSGFLPYWTDPSFRMALFRPLSSALMWVDHTLFGTNPRLYHVHSAAWWLAMLGMWAAVAKRLLPPSAALISVVLAAAHPVASSLIGWIANRNATVSSFFALLALWAQLRARSENFRFGRPLSIASYALALSASEYALGFIAFSLAYELCELRSWSARRVLERLGPIAGLILLYAAMRTALGFGTRASGMYIDPVAEPKAFALAALERFPVLVGDLVLGLRSNWWCSGYPWAHSLAARFGLPPAWALDLHRPRILHAVAGVLALPLAAFVAWTAQRAQPSLRFLALALPFAVLPATGSMPESRLLLPSLFGWALLLSSFTFAGLAALRVDQTRGKRLRVLLGVTLALLGTWRSTVYSAEDATLLPRIAAAIRRSILDPALDPVLASAQDVLLVSATDPTTTLYIPLLRRWHGHAGPIRSHLLLSTISPFRLLRLSERSFRLERTSDHYTPADVYGQVFERDPLQEGQNFESTGLRATIERTSHGLPLSVRFELDYALDDRRVVLLAQTLSGLRVMPIPPVGGALMIEPPALPLHLMR